MQLKSDAFNSKYSNVKNITHMYRRWSTPQKFCLVFIDELEKQLFIALKTTINFEKKWKILLEISSFYTNLPKTTIAWVQFLWYGVTQREYFAILGLFCHFTTLTTRKIKISKKWKKTWRCYHYNYLYQKLWSYDIYFLRYEV